MYTLIESDLTAFHHTIKDGDQIFVMRPEGSIHDTYVGTTPDRFNFREQFIDLTDAVIFPAVFNPTIPEQVLDFVEGLEVPRGDHTFSIGINDFIVTRRN